MARLRTPEGSKKIARGQARRSRATPRERGPRQLPHPGGVPESAVPSTYSNLVYHLIFATKRRAPSIEDSWRDRIHGYLGGTIKGLGGTPLAIGGVADHVHILVALRPSHCLADLVRDVKKASSTWVHKEMVRTGFAWQEGYAAFTVGPEGVEAARAYVANQEEHHRRVDSREELLRICREMGIEVELRFFE